MRGAVRQSWEPRNTRNTRKNRLACLAQGRSLGRLDPLRFGDPISSVSARRVREYFVCFVCFVVPPAADPGLSWLSSRHR